MQSNSTITRYIYREQYNIKSLSKNVYLLNIKMYIKSKGPLKGYYI